MLIDVDGCLTVDDIRYLANIRQDDTIHLPFSSTHTSSSSSSYLVKLIILCYTMDTLNGKLPTPGRVFVNVEMKDVSKMTQIEREWRRKERGKER